jgi:hypothetical protein
MAAYNSFAIFTIIIETSAAHFSGAAGFDLAGIHGF